MLWTIWKLLMKQVNQMGNLIPRTFPVHSSLSYVNKTPFKRKTARNILLQP